MRRTRLAPLTVSLSLSLAVGASAALALAQPPPAPAPTAPAAAAAPGRKVLPVGTRPESITRGWKGKLFISVMGGNADADGGVRVIEGDEVKDFAMGMDEPKGICFTGKLLVVSDMKRVWRVDEKGEKTLLVDEDDFPQPPSYLNDVSCEPGGKAVYVVDMGANTKMRDPQKKLWALDSAEAKALPAVGRVYRVGLDHKVAVAVDSQAAMPCPNGVSALARNHLLVAEFFTGTVFESRGKRLIPLATGLRGADGVEQDAKGTIYVSSWEQGKVWSLRRPKGKAAAAEPVLLAEGFQSAADFFLDRKANQLLLPDMKAGTLTFIDLAK